MTKHNLGPGFDCLVCGEKFKIKETLGRHRCPGKSVKIGSMPGRIGGRSQKGKCKTKGLPRSK